jgi:hypothetical protein
LVGLLERAALCRWTTAGVEAGTPHAAQWHYDWSRPWRRYRREKPSNHDSSATVLSVTCRPSCTPLGGPWFMCLCWSHKFNLNHGSAVLKPLINTTAAASPL